MDDAQARLIAEQLGRLSDSLNSRMAAIEESIKHHTELDTEKIQSIRDILADIKDQVKDHEQRIRTATDGVTSFRVWTGLSSGGSGLMSVIALIKSFLP